MTQSELLTHKITKNLLCTYLLPQVKELLSIPSPKPLITVSKIVTTLGVAVAGVAIISGIYVSSKK